MVASYGQGQIGFDTYFANAGAGIPTLFGSTYLGNTFNGALLYSLTPISDSIGTALTVSNPLTAGWTVGLTGVFGTDGDPNGYVNNASNLQLSALQYPSGSTAQVYFEIIAYNGANYNSSTIRGHSASFTEALATGTALVPITADGLNGGSGLYSQFSVFTAVPEPTTMALGGLGLAALLVARRKKA
jgi:hypothetical protein